MLLSNFKKDNYKLHLSFCGKIWNFLSDTGSDCVSEIIRCCNIPELTARILINRGITNVEDIESFIDTKLKDTMPDPSGLLDMDLAVKRIIRAISQNEKIFVLGDYDVDGVTSTYLLVSYLQNIGADVSYHIPDRFTDGYGVSEESINLAHSNNSKLFISVDSGVCSINEIDLANSFEMDSIIIDHHMPLPNNQLPKAVAVVNPNRSDQKEIGNHAHIRNLSAAGVVFLFLIALQRELKKSSFFDKDHREVDLKEYIGIVALGTLCDVMSVIGLNRSYVNFALKMQKFPVGLRSLMKQFNINKISSSEDFSFLLGPAINAAGRIGNARMAVEMLLSNSEEKATSYAKKLIELNTRRKDIERTILSHAMLIIEQQMLHKNSAIFVYGDAWHEGVIGIIAGKLKDKYHKPTFVVTFNSEGVGKGSARSTVDADLSKIFHEANKEGVIIRGGGHALAGGFSMSRDKIDKFYAFLNSAITNTSQKTCYIDAILPATAILKNIQADISLIEPFGKKVERPLFCMKNLRIQSYKTTADNNHMSIFFTSKDLTGNLRAMLFSIHSKNDIAQAIKDNVNELTDIAFYIKDSEKYGPGIIIEDVRRSIPANNF